MTKGKTFPIRMLFAPSKELIDYAREFGCNWVVAASTGHKGAAIEESPPAAMPGYPRLAAAPGAVSRPDREGELARLRGLFAYAKRAGLKTIYHTYEPSMPFGFLAAYPELYSGEIREYAKSGGAAVRRNRNLCVARPEVREAIAAKVEELCRALPGLDGLMYTNNESSSTTKVWHRCDVCRDIPFPRMMQHLHEAMQEGIRRSGRPVRLFYRCWGSHDHDHVYYGQRENFLRYGFGELAGEEWLEAFARCFKPAHLHFKPSRDNPAFARWLAGRDTVVVYKASWADTNLHHPLNPWIGAYGGNEQVCELSFEHCRAAPQVFFVMAKEMQRRARLCARKGVAGLCAVPLCWGMQDHNDRSAHPRTWSLAEANMRLFAVLMKNPEADLVKAAQRYLRDRYGAALPRRLAELLLESEDIAADGMNVRGVRATGDSFKTFMASLHRYGPMFPNWPARLSATPANVERIVNDKVRAMRRAAAAVAEIRAFKGKIPKRAQEEFELCFEALARHVEQYAHGHIAFMLMASMAEGHTRPTPLVLDALHTHILKGKGPELS